MAQPQPSIAIGRVVDLPRRPIRETIATLAAPVASGPYVQAIRTGDSIYASGQIGLDPDTGELAPGGVSAETRQALANLRAVLEAGSSSLDQVVKATVFLIDMGEFAAMNTVYAEFFPNTPPARSTVAVAALPRGARVEIDAVALAATA